ncbi:MULTISPECIES: hypothetical protein [Bradyrhizobium]|jgi:hypothetical protein|uniref:Uncharacterized protein n=1 Tax=Bradyrhizobium elkanii TaxID=29448 RepID=A0A8I1YCQ7_BRAEL|nr:MULTISPECIES: hypothetical protein [Bradyrhizobium]MBP1296997.1 hypothetical protein [Bradyrhizobium elkanii]MCS3449972.1 hypothetical protein [Bradyrhizobium elkanii]MCS3558883.1 hypothetical protein [Bradyrhizobium elkanii]MCS3890493.1 hypothetical protein [Bradyrhizobium elkanii]MCS4219907.1 hypothetical protein [Bradyrhizobium elkanii]
MSNKLDAIARAIKALTYDETEELARDLHQTVKGRMEETPPWWKPTEQRDWMELLQDWATYQLEDK